MPYIQFTALGDLFAFLLACHTRQEALGRTRKREKYSRLHLGDGPSYSIGFARGDWSMEDGKDAPFSYGGKIVQRGEPSGQEVHLNDLLRRLPLLTQPVPPRPHALVLAVSNQDCKAARPLMLLHEAWRQVPKLDGAESRFCVRQRQDEESWAAVEIREVAAQFNFASLQQYRDQGLVVFSQAWNEPNCFLYVQWGFSYPKPTEFAALYDERAEVRNDEGKIEAVSQLLLVRAGKRAGNLRTTGKAALHNARWLRVALPSHSLTEDLYDLTLPPEMEFAQIHAAELDEKSRLGARLEAGELRHVVGTADEIERRIAQCGSELEDLLTRKARLATRRHSAWLPAYTFDQREGEPLPEKLRLFLRRPLGEIAQFRYMALRVSAGRRHCLVGDAAVPWGAALAVPSDATWLCDARWREWSLPLFLRSDCALTVHVDEENMAAKVRDLLLLYRELDLGNTDSVILTEPAGPHGGLTFCPLAPVQTLDAAIGFFNDEMGCRQLAAESFERAGTDLVSEQEAAVSEEVRQLDASLQERAEEVLRELEEGWTSTRERAMSTLLRLRVTEAAMEIGEAACVESAEGWVKFVNHVLEIDARIAKVKLEAAERWFIDEPTRQARFDAAIRAQRDFTAELAQSKVDHEAAKKWLEEERRQIETALEELDRARAAAVGESGAVSTQAIRLQTQNKLAEVELKNAQAALAKLEQALEQAGRLREQLDQTHAEMADKSQQHEERRAEIGNREMELAKLTAEVRLSEENVQQALEPLRQSAEEALSFVRSHLEPPPVKPSFAVRIARFFGAGKKKPRG